MGFDRLKPGQRATPLLRDSLLAGTRPHLKSASPLLGLARLSPCHRNRFGAGHSPKKALQFADRSLDLRVIGFLLLQQGARTATKELAGNKICFKYTNIKKLLVP